MKRIQCKSDIQKQAKTHLNQYAKSFSVEGLKDVVMEFHNGKITEVQATQQITQLSKQRADLEDQSNKGKILTILPSLHKDDIKSKERDILTELSNLQNIFQFSQGMSVHTTQHQHRVVVHQVHAIEVESLRHHGGGLGLRVRLQRAG